MPNRMPHIFISSTCFDLRQVRADLQGFLSDQLGYTAVLSESSQFPIDPSVDAIVNCRQVVENDADVLVLIVGSRYGFVPHESEISVTNIEYLTARKKGIPIYVFVEKSVMAALPIWLSNPNANFSGQIDNPKLFDFVNKIQTEDSVWTRPFETAQDIIGDLRVQFAYGMSRGLDTSRRLSVSGDFDTFSKMSGAAIRIVIEKPGMWEYRLFIQLLIDELNKRAEIRKQFDLGMSLGEYSYLKPSDASKWLRTQLAAIEHTVYIFGKLYNVELNDAFGPHGKPGDWGKISFVARQIGHIYEETLLWAGRIRRCYTHAQYQPCIVLISKSIIGICSPIEALAATGMDAIDNAHSDSSAGRQDVLDLSLKITFDSNLENEIKAAMDRAFRYFRLHADEF